MDGVINFLASSNGRIARIVAGIVLILIGFLAVTGAAQIILVIVGLVPLLAGIFDYCVFAPLAGKSFSGKKIRGE